MSELCCHSRSSRGRLTEMAAALRAAASRMSPLGAAAVRLATWLPARRMELMVPPATQVAVHSLGSSNGRDRTFSHTHQQNGGIRQQEASAALPGPANWPQGWYKANDTAGPGTQGVQSEHSGSTQRCCVAVCGGVASALRVRGPIRLPLSCSDILAHQCSHGELGGKLFVVEERCRQRSGRGKRR